MQLDWVQCSGDVWCSLSGVVLSNVVAEGVYIIWGKTTGTVVYVGEGKIRDRLQAHRVDSRMSGDLLVTWAAISDHGTRLAVEKYLHARLSPLLSSVPGGPQIQVNLPWALR